MRIAILPILAIMLLISPVLATDAPQWTGNYVNDYAGILDNSAVLESMLRGIESNSTVEFAIVTISKLPADETMETYAYKIFNTWGIGKKSENNGLLLLMIANGTPGNRLRLEVGYGLEGTITDATAGRILDDALPYYEVHDYSQAAYIIVSDVRSIVEEKYLPASDNTVSTDFIAVLFIILFAFSPFILIIIISIIFASKFKPKCPKCGSEDLIYEDGYAVCKNCGHRSKKKKRSRFFVFVAGSGGHGGGFGGGGFGGGGSGGGGAGR